MTIKMIRHESSSTTLCTRTLLSQPLHLPRTINLIKLQHSKLHLPMLMLNLLWLGVSLLLPLLRTTTETENEMKSGFLLDVVVDESAAVFELLSSEDEKLLVRWDSFLVLDLCFHIVDGG